MLSHFVEIDHFNINLQKKIYFVSEFDLDFRVDSIRKDPKSKQLFSKQSEGLQIHGKRSHRSTVSNKLSQANRNKKKNPENYGLYTN